MINLYDIVWGAAVVVGSPYWLLKSSARQKVLSAFTQRMNDLPPREDDGPAILIHAVSVGEMNATRALVQQLRAKRLDLRFYISATTETGFARGQELYAHASDITVVRFPLDFSLGIRRLLDSIRPDLVVLMELEVWPNFMRHCAKRRIPVILGNARLTTTSFRNYRLGGPIVKKMFRRLALICAQDETYGVRFLKLGVLHHRVVIAGTMKFDNANLAPPGRSVIETAHRLGMIPGDEPIWVCGSTGPGEEEIILRVYRKALTRFSSLRLVIVPRHPQRFEEVADLIEQAKFDVVRYSEIGNLHPPSKSPLRPVVLIDAMGVLRDFYSLADVVFVGRSLVDLGPRQRGSDMIEPAALGKPIIVGPHTDNFADAMSKFRAADALLEAPNEFSLEQGVTIMLSTPAEARAMAGRAMAVVQHEQGATERHVRVILQLLATARGEDNRRPADPRITFIGGAIPEGVNVPPHLTSRSAT